MSEVLTEVTFAQVMNWDRDTSRKNFANPVLRPLIDEAIRRHNEGVSSSVEETNKTIAEAQSARVAQDIEDAEKAQADRLVLQAEVTRQVNLTPDQRVAEYAAEKLKKLEEEREEGRARVAREREAARWNALRPEQQQAELDAEAAAIKAAEEKAETDRIAVEQADTAKSVAEKEEADKVAAEKAEADKKALEEQIRLAAEAAKAAPAGKKKFVIDFQAKDDAGNPIGRRTHLEAESQEELNSKWEKSYTEAVKYAERMKKRAEATPTPAPVEKVIPVLTDVQRAELEKEAVESKDTTKADLAKVKLNLDDANKDRKVAQERTEYERQQKESGSFIAAHPEFFPCEANAKVLADQMKGKYWTADNLEIAYAEVESKLASRPETNTSTEPTDAEVAEAVAAAQAEEARVQAIQAAEEQARKDAEIAKKLEQEQVAQSAAAAASVVVTTPVVTPTPAGTPLTAPNALVTERKLPVGGIEPGALHGARPTTSGSKTPTLTKQDIARMPREEYGKRMKDPNFVRMINALFAPKP
jgi:hypothetical protein